MCKLSLKVTSVPYGKREKSNKEVTREEAKTMRDSSVKKRTKCRIKIRACFGQCYIKTACKGQAPVDQMNSRITRQPNKSSKNGQRQERAEGIYLLKLTIKESCLFLFWQK